MTNVAPPIRVCIDKKVDPIEAARVAAAESRENAPGLVLGTPLGNERDDLTQAGALVTGKKWQKGRLLRVGFLGGDPRVIEKIKTHMDKAFSYVSLRHQYVDDPVLADIRVALQEGAGSWSYIGTDILTVPKNKPTMNFGWLYPETADAEYGRVVVHETFHAFGMIHEHQHPHGGIPWDVPKVYAYYQAPPNNWSKAEVDHNIFDKYAESQTNFSVYDPRSIMHYPVPNELTVGDFVVGRNMVPSEQDVAFLSAEYPKEQQPPMPPVAPDWQVYGWYERHGDNTLTFVKGAATR